MILGLLGEALLFLLVGIFLILKKNKNIIGGLLISIGVFIGIIFFVVIHYWPSTLPF